LRSKDDFSIFTRKFSAIFRLSRLHNHRIALRWARDVEWSLDAKIFALMIWLVNFIGMEKLTIFFVINKGIIFPRIPKLLRYFNKFIGTFITCFRVRMLG